MRYHIDKSGYYGIPQRVDFDGINRVTDKVRIALLQVSPSTISTLAPQYIFNAGGQHQRRREFEKVHSRRRMVCPILFNFFRFSGLFWEARKVTRCRLNVERYIKSPFLHIHRRRFSDVFPGRGPFYDFSSSLLIIFI